ncbi:MAG: tetratricopeptide repeat protein [Gemmatimonadetes bacterium]|nr:tetratricopeptide repeat protein [Gemmatimonadota bacterium]
MTSLNALVRPSVMLCAALAAGCAIPQTRVPMPPPEATPRLQMALAADPDNADLSWRLAASLRAGRRTGEAREVVDAALAESPNHAPSVHLLGVMREEAGDLAGALEAYERFLTLDGVEAQAGEVRDRITVVRRRMLETDVRAALDAEDATGGAPAPQTVAVFPFAYTGSAAANQPLGRALTHMVVTDMAATQRLTVLERLQVQLLADEITLTQQGLTDPATGVRGGRLLRAEQVIQGQVGGDAARIALEAAVLRTTSEAEAPTVEEEDALDRFFEAEGRLVVAMFGAMGIELTAAERELVGRRRTESLQALLAFGLGLEAQDAGRFSAARSEFERALTLDPTFEDAQIGLAEAIALEEAEEEDPEEFAGLGGDLIRPSPWELWLDRQGTYLPIEGIIPDVGGRDPYSETGDDERIGPRSGTVTIVIPRPGGGQ